MARHGGPPDDRLEIETRGHEAKATEEAASDLASLLAGGLVEPGLVSISSYYDSQAVHGNRRRFRVSLFVSFRYFIALGA